MRTTAPFDSEIDQRFWWELGRDSFGILLYGFTEWLTQKLTDVELVCFCARDGFILQDAYDRFRRVTGVGPPSMYLHVSRRALNVPMIDRLNQEALSALTTALVALTVDQFLARVNLDSKKYANLVRQVGFRDGNERITGESGRQRLRELFRRLEQPLLQETAAERQLLLRYLDQQRVLGRRRVAMVDLGWHGTLQRSLARILRRDNQTSELRGYYLGTFASARAVQSPGVTLEGYVCHFSEPRRNFRVLTSCLEIFEFAFAAPHGTVVGFAEESARIVPRFAAHDFDAQKRQCAEYVRQGALDFVEAQLASRRLLSIAPARALAPMARLLLQPTWREVTQIGNIMHADGFGADFSSWPIARPRYSLWRRPLLALSDYRRSFWRLGYLVRSVGSVRRARIVGLFLKRLEPYLHLIDDEQPFRRMAQEIFDQSYNIGMRISPKAVALLKRTLKRNAND
jgi:hypothetical protein